MNNIVKEHEQKIKDRLNVYPKVFYGKNAHKEMQKYVDKEIWKKKKKTANGYFNPEENEVYIFRKIISKDFLVGILAHELRHAYQYKLEKEIENERGKKIFNFVTNFYSLEDDCYDCRKSELDANYFAYEYCKENNLKKKVIKYYKKKKEKIEENRLKHKHVCP